MNFEIEEIAFHIFFKKNLNEKIFSSYGSEIPSDFSIICRDKWNTMNEESKQPFYVLAETINKELNNYNG